MRSEFFFPKVSDRSRREKWVEEGGKDARQRAREIAINILATHKPLAISSHIQAKIKSGVKGMV
jgi:trimethylamine--corrinoid protein Co-methyltransferase